MADPIREFFDQLMRRGGIRLPGRTSGVLRFDLSSDGRIETWQILISEGKVELAPDERTANCVVRLDRELFERVVEGREEVFALVLRNSLAVEGDFILLTLFRRLFPGRPDAKDPRDFVQERRASSWGRP